MKRQPEYHKIKEHISRLLKAEQTPPHSRLPSERELCDLFSANRNTVRHAMRVLEREGAIYRIDRRGWFASGRRLVHHLSDGFVNFDKLVRSQGMDPSWIILEHGEMHASGELSTLFGVNENTPLYYANEVGLVDGLRVYYDESYFLASACPGILPKLADRPTTDIWREDYSICVIRKSHRIRPVSLHSLASKRLEVSTGTPGLFMRSIKTSPNGQVVWIAYTFWRYDALELRQDDLKI